MAWQDVARGIVERDIGVAQRGNVAGSLKAGLAAIRGDLAKKRKAATKQQYDVQQLGIQAKAAATGRAETAKYRAFPETIPGAAPGSVPVSLREQAQRDKPSLFDLMKLSQKNAMDKVGIGGAMGRVPDKELLAEYEKVWRKDFENYSKQFGYDSKAAIKAVEAPAETTEDKELTSWFARVQQKFSGV